MHHMGQKVPQSLMSDIDPFDEDDRRDMSSTGVTTQELREGVRDLCARYPDEYWRDVDARDAYPEEFVDALTKAGWLAALIPAEYGGAGLGLGDASVILEEVNRSGGNAGACHAQMYIMGTVLRHGSDEQKQRYLPAIAAGELRLQAFGVTEPDAGLDTSAIRTRARRDGDHYVVNGQKIWISRAEHSDLMLLLARTSAPEEDQPRWRGLSTFIVDLRDAPPEALRIVADRDDAQPLDDRGLLRRPRDPAERWSARRAWASATSSTA